MVWKNICICSKQAKNFDENANKNTFVDKYNDTPLLFGITDTKDKNV